jgi:hypothetical protein
VLRFIRLWRVSFWLVVAFEGGGQKHVEHASCAAAISGGEEVDHDTAVPGDNYRVERTRVQ